jgi:diguanylate cyclase (GGDEF)-like protein
LRQATLRRQLSRVDAFADMVRAVNSSLDPERVADAMLTRVAAWVPASGWLVAVDDGRGATLPMASRSLTSMTQPAALAVARFVVRSGEHYGTADTSADQRLAVAAAVAAIGFPLTCRGRTVGALVAVDRMPAAREPRLGSARAAIDAAIEPGAVALDNALRIQRAEALSVTDDLTSLYNGRYLAQVLRREVKRAIRHRRPLSLLFIDLDGFKSINDTHGHLFGSRALIEAAELIRGSARETDVGARYGGDEFALVLPDTGGEGAVAVGERVRERIAAFGFLQPYGLHIRLTASVGIATLPDIATSVESLIQSADKAMYWVKDHGKNGIHTAEVQTVGD